MPTQYDEKIKTYKFYGNFCSWECMKSFNLYSKSSYKQHIFNLIQKFHDEVQPNKKIVNFAPPKELLSCFGGTMDIENFRKNKEKYAVYDYPMKNEERIIERYENFSVPLQEQQNIEEIQNEPIKLKRKTPKVSTQHTLEKSMGVFKS
jgi:hypothetical protein